MTGHATTCKAPWAALVVDDDAGVRQSLRLCLEAAGARVSASRPAARAGGSRSRALRCRLSRSMARRRGRPGSAAGDAAASARRRRHRRDRLCVDRERGRCGQTRRRRLYSEALYAGPDSADGESGSRGAATQTSAQRARTGARRERRAGGLRVAQSDLSAVPAGGGRGG